MTKLTLLFGTTSTISQLPSPRPSSSEVYSRRAPTPDGGSEMRICMFGSRSGSTFQCVNRLKLLIVSNTIGNLRLVSTECSTWRFDRSEEHTSELQSR